MIIRYLACHPNWTYSTNNKLFFSSSGVVRYEFVRYLPNANLGSYMYNVHVRDKSEGQLAKQHLKCTRTIITKQHNYTASNCRESKST